MYSNIYFKRLVAFEKEFINRFIPEIHLRATNPVL